MKTIHFIKTLLFAFVFLAFNTGCVHDDEYSTPPIECTDFTGTVKIADIKALYSGSTVQITEDLILEGYVSSSDETGNIYKTLYIQDAPENPTHGLTLSVNVTDMYAKFPVGSKVYIKVKDLYLGNYGGVVQLGDLEVDENGAYAFGRISETKYTQKFFKSCEPLATMVPLSVNIGGFNDNLIGALIQIPNTQFVAGVLCSTYALDQATVNKNLQDCSGNTVLVRNSGYSTFWNVTLPSGNGTAVAILSKFNTDYQLYVRDANDMAGLTGTRCGMPSGTPAPSCDPPADNGSIQDIKNKLSGTLTQITDDLNVTATVTANDNTGNLYKMVYIEDETGGIRLRLNRTSLYLDPKFKIGQKITVAAKDLYVGNVNGEIHLGGLYQGNIGNIEDDQINVHVFDNKENAPLSPTVITIANSPSLDAHVGKLVKFENVEFAESSTEQPYATTTDTNRTFEDCSGNTMIVRTSSFATFKSQLTPSGKGTLTGILSVFNGTYQIWLRNSNEVVMEGVRCDGSAPATTIFQDGFANLNNWTAISVSGAQVWNTANFGNPAPCAVMNGYSGGNNANEDWLVSKELALTGFANYNVTFETDGRFTGNPLKAYVTDNYTGNPTTTTWTELPAILDTDLSSYGQWTGSGNLSLNTFAGKTVRVAFKYTSTTSGATAWEVDNFKLKGSN